MKRYALVSCVLCAGIAMVLKMTPPAHADLPNETQQKLREALKASAKQHRNALEWRRKWRKARAQIATLCRVTKSSHTICRKHRVGKAKTVIRSKSSKPIWVGYRHTPNPRKSAKTGTKRSMKGSISFGRPVIYGGLDRATVERVVQQYRRRLQYCYARVLFQQPRLAGKIHVWFRIESNGRVYKSRLSRSTMNNNRVERCLVRRFRVLRFPAPRGGGVVIASYPLYFRP